MSKRTRAEDLDPRVWLLSYELATLEYALYGAQSVIASITEQGHDPDQVLQLTQGADAMVTLVALRLRDLGRVLRGEVDPALLRAAHNETSSEAEPNRGEDVVFGAKPR